jgi:membrane-bound lytic murein transglycosylase B
MRRSTAGIPKLLARFLVTALVALPAAGGAQGLAPDDPAVAAARSAFVDRMVSAHDFDRAELSALLDSATIDATILERIARPAERVIPWYEYRLIFMNDARIDAGAQFWREHAGLVEDVAREYGVAPQIVLAIVGVESLFGQRMGSFRVLDSLATLAFAYPPRAKFFGSELEQFLLTARREGPAHLDVLGSYAGAMGAGQFISSSYEAYAVDGDGDGRRDLWASWPDILASVANYFARHDWQTGAPVVVPAMPPAAEAGTLIEGLELDRSVGALREQGFTFDASLDDQLPAMLIGLEAGPDSVEHWVGLHNFRVITRYNRSVKYALAVFQLSEAIAAAYATEQGE